MFGNGAGLDLAQIDFQPVGVEAHRHVELEACRDDGALSRDMPAGEGDDAGRAVQREVAPFRFVDAVHRDPHLPATGFLISRDHGAKAEP